MQECEAWRHQRWYLVSNSTETGTKKLAYYCTKKLHQHQHYMKLFKVQEDTRRGNHRGILETLPGLTQTWILSYCRREIAKMRKWWSRTAQCSSTTRTQISLEGLNMFTDMQIGLFSAACKASRNTDGDMLCSCLPLWTRGLPIGNYIMNQRYRLLSTLDFAVKRAT
jgi:hypothetical protein